MAKTGIKTMTPFICRDGTSSVQWAAGRRFGAVMFDAAGRYADATSQTSTSTTRGFVDGPEDLPAGVLDACKARLREAKAKKSA